ncbi:hypothetical protein SLS58_009159 [Diplodia intermedia]|uniref:Uncharacterized protein n=1 Tax=Diplodia intermedia TaxID=856260 RepID=A0ABR3TEC3_9PEZI
MNVLAFKPSLEEILLREQNKPIYALGRCGRQRILEIDRYTFWGHRLSDLLDAFEAPPRDIWQRLKNQRNFNDWAKFLIGLLVLVSTVVSIVTGTVSTVYLIKQYNLALTQDCAEEDAARTLPGFYV